MVNRNHARALPGIRTFSSTVGDWLRIRHEQSMVRFASQPVAVPVHVVSVARLPRGDVLVIIGSRLAASGIVLIPRSLTPLAAKFRLSRSIRRKGITRSSKSDGEGSRTHQPQRNGFMLGVGPFRPSTGMLRHSVVIDRQGFQTVDQQSKRCPRARTRRWFDEEKRPSKRPVSAVVSIRPPPQGSS